MIRINLVPVRVTKKQIQIRQQAIVAGVVLFAAFGTVYWLSSSIGTKIEQVEQNTKDTQAKLKQLESTVQKIETFKKQKAELEQKLDVINKLLQGRKGPVQLLAELAVSKPQKLWINSMVITGGSLQLDGIANEEKTVIDFAQKLKTQQHIGNVEIKELQGGKTNSPQGTLREYVTFSIVTTVQLSG